MGQPLFVANGSAVATTTTTLALVAPASVQAGDTLVANIATNDNTTPSGFDARWVLIANVTSTASIEHSVYILPNCTAADAGATFNFTVAGTTVAFGQLSVYRGARGAQLATINTSTSANASSATVSWATLTPATTGGLIIAAFGYAKNGVSNGGMSGTNPTFTNRYISTTATGGTESLGLYDGVGTWKTATGGRTMATGATAAVNVGILFELLGDGGDGSGGAIQSPQGQYSRVREFDWAYGRYRLIGSDRK